MNKVFHVIGESNHVYACNIKRLFDAEVELLRCVDDDDEASIVELQCDNGCRSSVMAYMVDEKPSHFYCDYCGDSVDL